MAARGNGSANMSCLTLPFDWKEATLVVRTCAGSGVMTANVENNFGHASRNAKFLLHHRNTTPLTRVHVFFAGSAVAGEAAAVARVGEHQSEDQVVSVGPFTL